MENMVNVLDKGYVHLVTHAGSDLSVVNAAKVSYDRQSTEWGEKEQRLINFLAREDHTSPFRHAYMTFEVSAPLMVARQWFKYVVGSAWNDPLLAWNESSRRYITEIVEFYIPNKDEWRSRPENSKQGSGEPVDSEIGEYLTQELVELAERGNEMYEKAMEKGIAPEQARLFLPAYGMYVKFYWSCSLQGCMHFLNQRLAHDSQKEIQEYAQAVDKLARPLFPNAFKAFIK